MKKFLLTYWKDILLILFAIIGAIGIYEKITGNRTIAKLNDTIIALESDKGRLIAEFNTVRDNLDEATNRIREYEFVKQQLEQRNQELEDIIGSITEISGAIGESQRRAIDYNSDAREILQAIREGLLESDF